MHVFDECYFLSIFVIYLTNTRSRRRARVCACRVHRDTREKQTPQPAGSTHQPTGHDDSGEVESAAGAWIEHHEMEAITSSAAVLCDDVIELIDVTTASASRWPSSVAARAGHGGIDASRWWVVEARCAEDADREGGSGSELRRASKRRSRIFATSARVPRLRAASSHHVIVYGAVAAAVVI